MLEKELEFFEKNKDEYLKIYPGQFVLIREDTLAGSFTTAELAYNAGIARFGNVPFLIKQVVPEDQKMTLPAYTLGLLSA